MDFEEYLGWMAYWELEPWGAQASTWQLAFIGQKLARLCRESVRLDDLMMGKRPPPRPQTIAEKRAELHRGAESRR